ACAMRASSVATTTRCAPASSARRATCSTSVHSPSMRNGLPGSRVEPKRAGIATMKGGKSWAFGIGTQTSRARRLQQRRQRRRKANNCVVPATPAHGGGKPEGSIPIHRARRPWTPRQLAAAIRANVRHLVAAVRTERAFERADVGLALFRGRRPAAFAFGAHFQCHFVSSRAGVCRELIFEQPHGQPRSQICAYRDSQEEQERHTV